jgi:hypothetical protein
MIPTLTSALREIRDDLADRLEPLAPEIFAAPWGAAGATAS